MKEEIQRVKQMMKDLTDIKDKFGSSGNKEACDEIIFLLKDLTELMNF